MSDARLLRGAMPTSGRVAGAPRIAYVSIDSRMNFLRDALAARGCDVVAIEGDDIDRLTRLVGAGVSLATPRMEWWIRYQMSWPVRWRRAKVAARRLPDADALDAIVFGGSWYTVDAYRPDGTRIPTFHYIDQSMSRTPLPGEQRGHGPFGRPGLRAQRAMYARAGRVLTMSEWARDHTRSEHVTLPADRVEAVGWGPCAVDLSNEPVSLAAKQPLVLLVAMDFYRKGVDYFSAVAKLVRAERPQVRFVLVGADQSRSAIRVGDDVEYLGLVRDTQVLRSLFAHARVFLMPHRYDRAGHVLAEAMSAGTPVVTGIQGGPPEVPRRSRAGAALPPDDVLALAAAVGHLLDDDVRWSAQSANARACQAEYYSWDAVARRVCRSMATGGVPSMAALG